MAQEEKGSLSMAQASGEQGKLDAEAAEIYQAVLFRPKDRLAEHNALFEAAARNVNQVERKRCSEPLPQPDDFEHEGKKGFERRRLWTATKQESFDLPDEFKCQPEDNVFTEGVMSRQASKGRHCQRSSSVPARLPDIVPERKSRMGSTSPDVVVFSEQPKLELLPAKSILSTSSSSVDTEMKIEKKERKQNFEGTVHCETVMPLEPKRKKSVTFETAEDPRRIMSSKGKEARSHFRSSGYGSQSDTNSQVSQVSNGSSEQGSIFSEDSMAEKGTFDANDSSQFADPSVDGNVDNSEGGKSKDETQEPAALLKKKSSQLASSLDDESPCSSKPQTPEEDDEVELWRRQNCPDFHCGDRDVPNQNYFSDIRTGDSSYSTQHKKGNESESPANHLEWPSQSSDKLPLASAGRRDSRSLDRENSENKSSPTTKEECQRELYKQLFEERMLKFDPNKESIIDLFEWVKKNIAEALTPSPKSPFFPAEGTPPQNENLKISPGLAAVTNAIQVAGRTGSRDHLCIPNFLKNPAAPLFHPPSSEIGHLVPSHLMEPQRPFPGSRPPPGLPGQGLPPSHNPLSGLGMVRCPWLKNLQEQQPFRLPVDFRDGCGKGPGVRTPEWAAPADQPNVPRPPVRYQQDLPATLDDVLSICVSSGSDLSSSIGPSLVEQLVQISQCSYVRCSDEACVQAKRDLQSLQEALKRGPSHLSGDDLRLLSLLNEHYGTCELINCPVPWCRYLYYRYAWREKTSQALMKLFSCPLLTLLPASSECRFNVFVKMDKFLPGEKMPQEWEDWLMLYPLSPSYTVARVTPLLPVWPHKHWVVKVASLHESRNQLQVYGKLRGLQHTHIVSHVWMAASYTTDILVVCTEFLPGMSVRDLLDQKGHLSSAQTRHYFLQALSAAQLLHALDIIFLNWTCDNLLMDESGRTVKITNFTASVELLSGSTDNGDISLTLPGDIVPAELLVQGGELSHKSDSWGLACVLHEMLLGTRPWYHLRHCQLKHTKLEILKQVPPMVTADLPSSLRSMVQLCLQKSPDSRPSVKDMMEHCHSQWF